MIKTRCLFTVLCSLAINAYAGVMPSQSRIVYESSDKDESLMLANTNDYPVIVQTWIDKGEGTPDSHNVPFISIPPVFRLEPAGVKGVRIIYNQAELPRDKESIFWFNIYEIPPEKKNATPDSSVLVTMNTQIKLFYRPSGVNITPDEAIKKVICKLQDKKHIACHNPAPVHISVVNVQAKHQGRTLDKAINTELMLNPFGETIYQFENSGNPSDIQMQYIDDAGNKSEYTARLSN